MEPFLAFFLVFLTGIFSSTLLKKLHLPWVAALIIGGYVIGPGGFRLVEVNATIDFIAEMGLIFLMFVAGLDTKLSSFKKSGKRLLYLAFVNGLIPFLTGILITQFLGFSPITALLMGTVFLASSIAITIPTLEANNLIDTKIGQSVISAIIMQDIASLVLLSVILQSINPVTILPLWLFYPVLLVSLLIFRWIIPKLRDFLDNMFEDNDLFQQELRVIFVILIGTVAFFQLLGMHSIIGGFFAGLVLSESIKDNVLTGKIRAISYGFFIPTFFIVVGMKTDLHILGGFSQLLPITLFIIVGSMVSKFFSGFLGGKIINFKVHESLYFAAASIPILSTALAVSYTARELNLIPESINTVIVFLSIVTTVVGPTLMMRFQKKIAPKKTG